MYTKGFMWKFFICGNYVFTGEIFVNQKWHQNLSSLKINTHTISNNFSTCDTVQFYYFCVCDASWLDKASASNIWGTQR